MQSSSHSKKWKEGKKKLCRCKDGYKERNWRLEKNEKGELASEGYDKSNGFRENIKKKPKSKNEYLKAFSLLTFLLEDNEQEMKEDKNKTGKLKIIF